MTQIDLIATIAVDDDALAEVAALLDAYGGVVRAEAGNLRFETYRDASASTIVIIERYASADAFSAHLANPANAEFNRRLGDVLAGGGSVLQMLEPLARP